jgi:DNA-binding CsgD family transcriptional regulator
MSCRDIAVEPFGIGVGRQSTDAAETGASGLHFVQVTRLTESSGDMPLMSCARACPGVDHWPWIGNADEIVDVIEEFVTGRRPRRRARPNAIGIDALSPRQRQVLRRSIEGQTAAEIAGSLGVSVRTIETHLAHGYAKLGVRSRVELVRRYRDAAV